MELFYKESNKCFCYIHRHNNTSISMVTSLLLLEQYNWHSSLSSTLKVCYQLFNFNCVVTIILGIFM
ncbi:hypothetical protein NQ315_000351 [Exocentrus adspersus]|uniref:Uncharacterized protein n=1 Tax=Exocentrus adspersus TaxID=1586481 RepID=A0AAV8VLV7_9CUCU|nr:hypothetical protein NQ315_000351 [Exocentrus adspersus]